MKPNSLTSKQEKFAQLVVSGMSLSAAYRGAFDAAKCNIATINKRASELMSNGEITGRVDSLRAKQMAGMFEGLNYEYRDAMRELNEAIAFAKECKNPGAFVAALNLKQRISGLHVEDRKNDRSPLAGMSADRVRAALAAITALRKAKLGA